MKTVIVIALIAAAFGWVRHDRWTELKNEAARLEKVVSNSTPAGTTGEASRKRGERVLSSDVPPSLGRKLMELLELDVTAPADERKQLGKSVMDQFDGLDHREVAAWIAAMEADDSIRAALREKVAAACVGALSGVNPEEAMRLTALLPEGKVDASLVITTFTSWAARRPGEALRWYDEVEASGWAEAKKGTLLLRVLSEQARIDPAGALARMLSHEGTGRESQARHLGSQVGAQFNTFDEHRSFLIALERASKDAPDSNLLAGTRGEFILQLTSSLPEWPVDDAITLVDTGFRPDEKLAAARQAGTCVPREETERWADWVVDVADPADPQHPLLPLIIGWTFFDPAGPGHWIAKEPAGPVRDQAMSVYLSRVETFDSATAISCLASLPDSPRKAAVMKRARQQQQGQ
jgi:hypothetical protein